MRMRFAALLTFAMLSMGQRPPVEAAWDLLLQGRREEAVGVLHSIIKTNPRDADARLLLGSILAEEGKQSQAIVHLEEAVRLLPRSADAHTALGDAYNRSGDARRARAEFETAANLDPELAPARVSLGLILVEAGELAAAASHLDRALKILGDDEEAAFPHYLRAKIYTQENQAERAAAELTAAVRLRPDFAEAWSDLGQTRKTLLDDAGALAAFQRSVDADPENAVSQYRLGAEYLDDGKVTEAVQHLEAAYRLDPHNQSTLNSLQLALRRDGQSERAASIRKELAELIRERDTLSQNAMIALSLNNEGAALEKRGQLREALAKYRQAVALDPSHVGFRINFGAALLRLGRWSEGIAELRDALRRDPEDRVLKQALEDALAQAPAGADPGRGAKPDR